MKKISESNSSFLRSWVREQESLIPSFAKIEAKRLESWSPEKGFGIWLKRPEKWVAVGEEQAVVPGKTREFKFNRATGSGWLP